MAAAMESLPVAISALQHYLYCPRQCALIHLEQQWAENRHTVEGKLLHTRTDKPGSVARKGVRTATALPLHHPELGLRGVADVVEFHVTPCGEQPHPVEYKRGRPKQHRADEVQLCAQALCLEHMFNRTVREGALYYGKTHRRKNVPMDEELRVLTLQTITDTRAMLASGVTPPPHYERRKCEACSLLDICQPQWFDRPRSARHWLLAQMETQA